MSIGSKLKEALNSTPYKFQIQGVRFVEKCDGNALICDDMGLGKTLQALGWVAIHPEVRPVVVVCPASVKYGWKKEFRKHASLRAHVCEGHLTGDEEFELRLAKSFKRIKKKLRKGPAKNRRTALKAARRACEARKAEVRKKRRVAKKQPILIINYDIIDSWRDFLVSLEPQLLIMDECQYVKNRRAKRTKACRVVSQECFHVLGLSGTPISGRPEEFFPALNMIRPDEFPSFWKYSIEYCAPRKNPWGGGMIHDGATNLEALHFRLKKFMIRRMKGDPKIKLQLPKKTRTVMPIAIDNRKEYRRAEENFLTWYREVRGQKAMKRALRAQAIVKLNALKLLAAQGKMAVALKWIEDWLESTDEKLIVFAYHKVIMDVLKKAFPTSAIVDGTVTGKKRQEQVAVFQENAACRVFLGQRKASGVGLDGLQHASSNVLFLEIGWTPAEHEQAEDRALRIGQKHHVNVYYLVGRRTVEERILGIVEDKDDVNAQILDGKKTGSMKLLTAFLNSLNGV